MDNNFRLDLSLPETGCSSALSEEAISHSRPIVLKNNCSAEELMISEHRSRTAESTVEEGFLRPYIAFGVVDHHIAPALLGGFENSAEIHEEMYHQGMSAIKPNQIIDDNPHPLHIEAGFHLKF